MAPNVDHLTWRREPSGVSSTADPLENQATEHDKRDNHGEPNQQFQKQPPGLCFHTGPGQLARKPSRMGGLLYTQKARYFR